MLRMVKPLFAGTVAPVIESIVAYVATSAGIRSSEFFRGGAARNACYMTSLYVLDFKCVLNFDEAQASGRQLPALFWSVESANAYSYRKATIGSTFIARLAGM